MDIIRYLLAPILLVQEKLIRSRVVKLSAPKAPSMGVHGEGPLVRLLVLGDSTAESVGIEKLDQTFMSNLLTFLERCQVEWQLVATTGYTSQDALIALRALDPKPFDVVITALGVNDVTGHVSLKKWLQIQKEIREYSFKVLNSKCLVISGVLPIWKFPALPQPLKWYLSKRAKAFDDALREQLRGEKRAHYLDMDFSIELHHLAKDGYHPGPDTYQEWARRCAHIILTEHVMMT